jgi:hypothetical protein
MIEGHVDRQLTTFCTLSLDAVTRLSDYVATTGCTPAVQSMLQDVVNNDYGGNPLPVTTALRSLDVKDTSVSNLGECFQIALSSEPAPEPSPSG